MLGDGLLGITLALLVLAFAFLLLLLLHAASIVVFQTQWIDLLLQFHCACVCVVFVARSSHLSLMFGRSKHQFDKHCVVNSMLDCLEIIIR